MLGKQKAKTPQPSKGQKQKGQKTPQSAPAGKKPGNEMSAKAAPSKLFQNGQGTRGKGKGTPKAGDKRKLDNTPSKGANMAVSSKLSTPAAKGKHTPAKLPPTPQFGKAMTPRDKKTPQAKKTLQARKTPQVKTHTSAGKGGKKATPQVAEEDSEEEDDADEEEEEAMGNLDMDSDDDDDLEEDMDDDDDDDDDDEESEESSQKKNIATMLGAMGSEDDSEEDDDDDDSKDDDDDSEDDDDDDDEEDGDSEDENSILKKIRALRQTSGKQQKQKGTDKEKPQDSKTMKLPQSPSKQPQPSTKQPPSPTKQPQSPTKPSQTATKQKKEPKQPQSAAKQEVGEKSEQLPKTVVSGDRDKRTLFVKNLPPVITVQDIKTLSKDIKEVRLRITVRAKKRQKKKMGFAFIEFASEAVADKNYTTLQGAKLGDCEVVVDYVGEKSKYLSAKPKKELADPDPLRLYITGFGGDVKEADLHKLFPKAQEITLPLRKKDKTPVGYAFAAFATEQQCKTAHEKCQGVKLQGHSLVVLYAKKRSLDKQQKVQNQKDKASEKKSQPPAKKAKVEDSASDDDEDDDDEEEDDDDDEEEDDEDDDDNEDDEDEDDDDGAEDDEDDDDDDDDDDE